MPFQKGNQEAKKKGKHKKTLQQEAREKILLEEIAKEWRPLCQVLVSRGLKGDMNALKEILERYLGKVKERQEIDFNPIPILKYVSEQSSSKENNELEKKN